MRTFDRCFVLVLIVISGLATDLGWYGGAVTAALGAICMTIDLRALTPKL